MLKQVMTGAEVTTWQKILGLRGYPVIIDGVFGMATKDATVRFQIELGVTADGIVGPQTIAAYKDKFPLTSEHTLPNIDIKGEGGKTPWLLYAALALGAFFLIKEG